MYSIGKNHRPRNSELEHEITEAVQFTWVSSLKVLSIQEKVELQSMLYIERIML